MRTGSFLILFLSACLPFTRQQEQPLDSAAVEKQIQNAHRIVIYTGTWGIHSGSNSTEWVLEDRGGCYCEQATEYAPTMRQGASEPPKRDRHDVPAEAFREIQQILIASKIWAVKERRVFEFEGGVHFGVEWDGVKHNFNYHPAESKNLMAYLNKLPTPTTH